jgi:DNA-directed RNA polymerase specialized sigma24 family protein
MAQHPPEGPEGEQVATRDETISAWRALSTEDKKRLDIYAALQARMRRKYAPGITGEDLLQEGWLRVFKGRRKWRMRQVEFLPFMFGVIDSIGSDLARTKSGKLSAATLSEGSLRNEDDPEEESPLDRYAVNPDTPEAIAIANEQFAGFHSGFEDDETAWLVLECIAEGLSGAEIQQKLEISHNQFEAARKKIARRAPKYFLSN